MTITAPRTALLAAALAIGALTLAPARPAAQTSRLLDVVELLANGEVVFGSFANVESGASGAVEMARSDADYIFFDMEHGPLDMVELRDYMQYLLDPAQLLRRGRPGTDKAVWVRIPANGREMNEWMIKNALDQGAHGIIAPAYRDGGAGAAPRAIDALPAAGRSGRYRAGRAPRLRSRQRNPLLGRVRRRLLRESRRLAPSTRTASSST